MSDKASTDRRAVPDEFGRLFSSLTPAEGEVLRAACTEFAIEPREVANHKFYGGESGDPLSVVIVTSGGAKLRYPIDERTERTRRLAELDRRENEAKGEIEMYREAIRALEGQLERLGQERGSLGVQA